MAVVHGINPLVGFAAMGLLGAGAMELMGTNSRRGRDLVTGIVLGASLGLSALFLYLSITGGDTTGAVVARDVRLDLRRQYRDPAPGRHPRSGGARAH